MLYRGYPRTLISTFITSALLCLFLLFQHSSLAKSQLCYI
uniref:Uncharacterized protein n=1 Tax=Ciona intestinalis TaxID=7719 RepID=H2XRA1_CIOIN